MKILVTGCAGFIGSHLCERLLVNGHDVIGVDNLNDYYDITLKEYNLSILLPEERFTFIKEDICSSDCINKHKPDKVCHLAAMAGVRYSLSNPEVYIKNNIMGTINLLNQSVASKVKLFVYASSSSVYGLNSIPFKEDDCLEKMNSHYAVSKKSVEDFCRLYNQLYNLNVIGLRFFTVYGPSGRPDMAPYKFLNAIKNNEEIQLYGDGTSFRDYTYIDDIIDGTIKAIDNCSNNRIFNLGCGNPITLNNFVQLCEKITNRKANIKYTDKIKGDVFGTFADIKYANKKLDYKPKTDLETGLKKMWKWLNNYESKNNSVNTTDITET